MKGLVIGVGLVALAMGAAAPPDPRDSGPDHIDVSTYPPEYQETYTLFAEKCSKCHTLARPINARVQGEEWKGYIKKMIRRPGSGINEEAGQRIYEFLKYYSTVGRKTGPAAQGGAAQP